MQSGEVYYNRGKHILDAKLYKENCLLCRFVKRYQENEIVLNGCGGEEYIFRKNEN